MRVGHGEKMSRKMNTFMQALLSSATIENAAAISGISSATAYRWHSQPDFQLEFKRLQGEVTGHALAQLKNSMGEALTVLRNVMGDAGNPPSARVAAARTILDNAFKSIETADIIERLDRLEEAGRGEAPMGAFSARLKKLEAASGTNVVVMPNFVITYVPGQWCGNGVWDIAAPRNGFFDYGGTNSEGLPMRDEEGRILALCADGETRYLDTSRIVEEAEKMGIQGLRRFIKCH